MNHKGYTERSFEFLGKHLGCFEGEGLRKILELTNNDFSHLLLERFKINILPNRLSQTTR